MQEAVKGNVNDPRSVRNRVRGNMSSQFVRGQAEQYRRLNSWGSKQGGLRGRAKRWTGGRLASGSAIFGDAMAREAALIEQGKARINQIKDNGDDTIINARASYQDANGNRWTLDGKPVTDADYRVARRLYPRLGEMQAVAEYRLGKVNTAEEQLDFANRFGMMAQQEGLTESEATGALIGIGFGKQAERGEMKYGRFTHSKEDGQFHFQPVGGATSFEPNEAGGEARATGFIKEAYSKRGSFEAGRQLGSYYNSMADIKQRDAKFLEDMHPREASGQLSATEQARVNDARNRLRMTLEYEKAVSYPTLRGGGEGQEGFTPEQIAAMQQRGGGSEAVLSGASAETAAAFKRLQGIRNAEVERLDSEIQTRSGTHMAQQMDQRPENPDARYR
jgi:hypothetical protein